MVWIYLRAFGIMWNPWSPGVSSLKPYVVHHISIHMLCRDLCWLQTEKHDFLVLLSLSAQHKFDT